jgi:putative N-acetylmannosamine-6-phosphate epimerase
MANGISSHLIPPLRGGLIVSVQADEGSPLNRPEIIAALAQAVAVPGVVALRLNGPGNITAVRGVTGLPIIGLFKEYGPDGRVWITPTFARAAALAEAGANIIALDATWRARLPGESVGDLIGRIHTTLGVPVMADISSEAEGLEAAEAGADLVGTTLAGYTRPPFADPLDPPDLELIRRLAPRLSIPLVAEGRLNTPALARQALEAGAHAVVVGSMITRPEVIARSFVKALASPPKFSSVEHPSPGVKSSSRRGGEDGGKG